MKTKAMQTAIRGRLSAEGPTKAAAKAALDEKVDDALDGDYTPLIVSWNETDALVWREPDGWYYRMLSPRPFRPAISDRAACCSAYGTRSEALDAAAFDVLDDHRVDFHDDADIPAFLRSRTRRSTLLANGRFARAWRWAKANGIEQEGLHQWACMHAHEERFA